MGKRNRKRRPSVTRATGGKSVQSSESKQGANEQKKPVAKILLWTTAATATAVIGLIVSGVLPTLVNQIVNVPKLEDSMRQGPDIIAKETLFNIDGTGDLPDVIGGNYQPSAQLVQELSRPMAATSTTVIQQLTGSNSTAVDSTHIQLDLEGNRNEIVRIIDIHPVNLHRRAPLNGVLFDIGPQGADGDVQVAFDLDEPFPDAQTVNSMGMIQSPKYFDSNTISLTNGEHVVIVIRASTSCYDARFDLGVDYTVGGTQKSMTITEPDGKPFEVTAYRFSASGEYSYRQVYELRGNFSVTPLTAQQLQLPGYSRNVIGMGSCPSG
jgi:hypothetical protein